MDKPSYCLSNTDISKFFNGQVKILIFSQIADYDTLDQLLAPYGRVVILFEKKKGTGHWTCLFRGTEEQRGTVFFFDPYGIKPEGELRYSAGKNRYLNQMRNTLLRLFRGHNVKYNDVPLQKWSSTISTCGRWVIARMSCSNLNSYQFADLIKSSGIDPDKYITSMTNLFLNK